MAEVYIVFGYEHYEMPFQPIACFAKADDAAAFRKACIEHDERLPPYPPDDCSDSMARRWQRKYSKWQKEAPYGKDMRCAGYDVHTMQVREGNPNG